MMSKKEYCDRHANVDILQLTASDAEKVLLCMNNGDSDDEHKARALAMSKRLFKWNDNITTRDAYLGMCHSEQHNFH